MHDWSSACRVRQVLRPGDRPLSPVGFFFMALFYSVFAAARGHDVWYGVAWFAALVAIRQVAESLRERRSHGGRR